MLPYCLQCKRDTESKNTKVAKTSNREKMLLSESAFGNSKQLILIKKQEQVQPAKIGP